MCKVTVLSKVSLHTICLFCQAVSENISVLFSVIDMSDK